MTPQPPPPFAMWLLRRWTSGSRRESLIGDLLEQYGQGRSQLWFWRQTAEAVLFGAVSDACHHGVLVARAIVASLVLIYTLEWIPLWLYQRASGWMWNWSVVNNYDNLRVFWFGRPHWPGPPRMFANCFVAFVVGVIIARTHRKHSAAAVIAAAVAWPLFVVLQKLLLHGPTMLGEFWRSSPAWFLVAYVWTPLSVLIGGALGTLDVQESHSSAEGPPSYESFLSSPPT